MDILLLILLAVGFVSGLFSGAIKQVISLAAFVVGYIVACLYYRELGDVLAGFLSMPDVCRVLAFVLLWIVVPIVAKLIASMLTSLMDALVVTGLFNRLLGGLLGFLKYALVLGALVWLFSSMHLIKEETMQQSRLAGPLKAFPEFIYNNVLCGGTEGETTRRAESDNAACRINQRGVPNLPTRRAAFIDTSV